MADALISVVLELLAPFLLDKLKQEVKLVLGAPKDVQELFDTFDMIKYVLVDAEKRHIHKVLYNMEKREIGKAPESAWLEKLKEVSYQMEDVLDEWHTKLKKLEIDAGSNGVDTADRDKRKVQTTGKCKKMVWACFTSPCSCIKNGTLHPKIGSRILKLKKQLDILMIEKDKYKFEETRGVVERQIRLAEDRRDESCMIKLSEVCGRDLEKEKLEKKLLSENSDVETSVRVISIIGMVGIGKTTLAKYIYNQENVTKHFEKKMWVCVSDPFDLEKIAMEIIKEVDENISINSESWEALSKLLCKSIEGKIFLLVLDDVWTEDRTSWEKLKLSLDSGKSGSRIVVTTRDDAVADALDTNSSDKHIVGRLSDEDCWSLFERLAFKGTEQFDCQSLKEIGRNISDKCKGVPLHAKLLGSLMPTMKTTEEEWEKVLTSDIWDLPLVCKGVLPALLLSYNALPSHLKRCFTYFAVFPKDTEIKKDTLIKMWMAEGCLRSTESSELESIGEKYFTQLVMRSFFQELKLDKYGDIGSCKMHNLLHDLATFLGNNECQVAEPKGISLNHTKLRYLCVQSSDDKINGSLNSIWRLKSLRTLLAKRYGDSSLQDWAQMSNLTCLRTLDLSWASISELPKEVEKLISLRYLNLSCTKLKELPETITNLSNLQTLYLNWCSSLRGLPNELGKLVDLRHLEANSTELEELPDGICSLLNLQTLRLNGCINLHSLPDGIGNLVSLRCLDVQSTLLKEFPESFDNLFNLQRLELRYCGRFKILPNSMVKLIGLRHLDISRCALRWLPRGIGNLRDLRTLSDFIVSEEGCDLGELRDLNHLCGSLTIRNIRGIGNEAHGMLKNKKYLKGLHLEFCSSSEDDDLKTLELLEPHPHLEELKIYSYSGSKLPRWMDFLGTRQRPPIMLCRLIIYCCSNLKELPALGKLQFLEYLCLNDLKSLSPMSLEILEFSDGAVRGLDGDSAERSAPIIEFPKLKELVIMNMTNWEKLFKDTSMNMTIMPCLQILEVGFCPMLKSVPCQLLSSSLRKISVGGCPNLEFSCLPPFLEELKLFGDDAGSLSKSLPIQSGSHAHLKSLLIQFAKHSTLPQGIPHLTELQTLTIIMCPILAARCQKEGEDWNMIFRIPNIIIDHEMIKR